MSYYQPETRTYYDPMKDPQFEGLRTVPEIVKRGKPVVLGVSWEQAMASEIPAEATFTGNLTWPHNAYDGTHLEHLADAIRGYGGKALIGPPGTKRDHLKSEQGDYGPNKDQVGIYYVFKKDMAPGQP